MLTNMERKGDRAGDVHSLDMSYHIHGEKRQNLMLFLGVPVKVLHHFRIGSVQLSSGEVVSKYLLDEELQIIPGAL